MKRFQISGYLLGATLGAGIAVFLELGQWLFQEHMFHAGVLFGLAAIAASLMESQYAEVKP